MASSRWRCCLAPLSTLEIGSNDVLANNIEHLWMERAHVLKAVAPVASRHCG